MHVIGTAGHVDHGKSTLVEALTGIDPDRWDEEKRRGLTIDLGFAWLKLPSGREVGLIDVPGHERFIKNMLAGAGGVTVCLFVVAANEGWKPQSAEHLAALEVLGISGGVVALTKSDTVDAETLEIAVAEVEDRVAGTVLETAPVVACSATTGAGLDDLVAALDRVVQETPPAADLGRPRLWIDRVFTIAGAGTVVTGTLAGGSLALGDEVEIAPERRRARIRGIQSHKRTLEHVGPGNRVALNLAGLERQGAERGDAVVRHGQWRPTHLVDARIRVLEPRVTGRDDALTEKGAHLLYVGSAETPVRVKLLGPRRIEPGNEGFAQLQLRDPLPLARGDRFVLRDAGRVATFGGGEVLDPLPRPARRGDEERVELLRALTASDGRGAATHLLDAEGVVDAAELALRSGTDVPSDGMRIGHRVASPTHAQSLAERLVEELRRHHDAHPLERGMPREALRAVLGLDGAELDDLLTAADELLRSRHVVDDGATIRLSTHDVALDAEQQHARDELLAQIEGSGFTPPLAKDLVADADLVRALVRSGDLVKVGDFYLTGAQAREARGRVRAAIEGSGPKTVAEIRDLLGTSRKYAVPLCEWLDATGATRRRGDLRVLGPTP